ncbi:hypothetical protein COEREDRAFT_6747 [Coemansia reversa NRRL 1564]|uniref:Uncharacterized protein n=1 Tax=Coemansia reversa (strain ATCC 12441 / NRRL 1564) TaxID=763665 RepID=A0A2G5BG66_COERN|nr:hypothetical protein COEREDRAFT_6747 [Coemansia reversa NRRL 1564]|eukprot:PIA18000.1 hypothetical protein COEREDRAFT_6747 [Coemansia reversa NRRL 1564]
MEDTEPVCDAMAAESSCENALQQMEIDSIGYQPANMHMVAEIAQKPTRPTKHAVANRRAANCRVSNRQTPIAQSPNVDIGEDQVTGQSDIKSEVNSGLQENISGGRTLRPTNNRKRQTGRKATTQAATEQQNRPLTRSRTHAAKKRKHI